MTITSFEEWLERIDADSEDLSVDKDALYEIVKEGYETFDGPNRADLIWRMARAAYKVAAAAEVVKNVDKQKKFLAEAEEWAKKTLVKDPENGDGHLWLANTYGKICDHIGTKERIGKGKEIQQHLDKAVKIKPNDYVAFYTYGRWCIEVAKLSWLERKIAAAIFDKPPEATYSDAIEKFKRVEELKPDWRAPRFYMASCYVQLKNYKDAIKALDVGLACESNDEEDRLIDTDMVALQKKYVSYR